MQTHRQTDRQTDKERQCDDPRKGMTLEWGRKPLILCWREQGGPEEGEKERRERRAKENEEKMQW